MDRQPTNTRLKRSAALLVCLVLALAALTPVLAHGSTHGKVVRVGWYDSAFNTMDAYGRRSGYAYEYQQKIAAYTGWNYEYVEGSWSELLQMLIDGEIDLMSDVSYTEERAKSMLFSAYPMGEEEYYAFAAVNNTDIDPEDYTTLSGKRVGVNKGSIQAGLFLDWEELTGIQSEVVELTCSRAETIDMLNRGEIDVLVTTDNFGSGDKPLPVCRIGASEYYFAVRKGCVDLQAELDTAMRRIQDENRYYNKQLFDKYMSTTGAAALLSSDEVQWLQAHGSIRVGYQADWLPFCAREDATGELTGALKDYLALAENGITNAALDFVPVAYGDTEAAIHALRSGEVDCIFPMSISAYEGEVEGLLMTTPAMRTELYAVFSSAQLEDLVTHAALRAVIRRGNTSHETFIKDEFPTWSIDYRDSVEACYKAVAAGEADCTLASNYRLILTREKLDQNKLSSVATGRNAPYSFAVRRSDDNLYSILNKAASLISPESVESSLLVYTHHEEKVSLMDFIRDNWLAVIIGITVVFIAILTQLMLRLRAEREANEKKKLIAATESDALTGLYNRSFFYEYAERMFRESPEKQRDAVVLDIEQFHSVNDLNGWAFGDTVLKTIGGAIRDFLQETEGIAGRFEADRFGVYLAHREDYPALFTCLQTKLDGLERNASLRLRMGVMPWQEGVAPVQMFDRARVACSLAKSNFKMHLQVYNEELRSREIFEQRLLNDLRRGLDGGEFQVYYQPKYDIRGETPRLSSAEALVRWHHPELGVLPPADFVPLLERNGQIGAVDNFVWAEAARQIAAWRTQLGVTVPVSVNLSRVDLFDPELEHTLSGLVQRHGLKHSELKLEVTESAYTQDADQVVRVIRSLRDRGFEIEMDDFGTGYSSLNMLSTMPVDVLKLDRGFIQDIAGDERDLRMVELILDIARSLKVPVIAEGVETGEQLTVLRRLGCDVVQGYYFSRPVPAGEFEAFLREPANP